MNIWGLIPVTKDCPETAKCSCGKTFNKIVSSYEGREFIFLPSCCPDCANEAEEDLSKEEKVRLWDSLGIRRLYWNKDISTLVEDIGNEQAIRYAKAFIKAYPKVKGKGLYLHGGTGTGKTVLAVGILKAIGDGFIINAAELLDSISARQKDVAERVANARLLVIDDLGSEQMTNNDKPNNYVINRLYMIINRRYEYMLPTIVTTNVHPNDLCVIMGDRISSRILGVCIPSRMDGEDRRRT